MLKYLLILFLGVSFANAQIWASRSIVVDHIDYFMKVIQETVYEVEKIGWWNLKVPDLTNTFDEQMYKWHVKGRVNYTNGFLVSIQELHVTSIQQFVSTISSTNTSTATVTGELNLMQPRIGFDMIVKLINKEKKHYTAVIPYVQIVFTCSIEKNLNTDAISVNCRNTNFKGENARLTEYLPADHITEVISRTFFPTTVDIDIWAPTLNSILLDVVTKRVQFPVLCHDCLN